MTELSTSRKLLLGLARRLVARVPGHHVVQDIYGKQSHKLTDIRDDPPFGRIAEPIVNEGRSYLYSDRLFTLYQAIRSVSACVGANEKALLVEVGTYRGGGSRFIAETARELLGADRVDLYSVDTFEGHSAKDLPFERDGAHTAKKFGDTSVEDVRSYLADLPFVRVVQGRIQDVADQLPAGPVQFVHLDVDIYEPTLFALNLFYDRLAKGAVLVVDDYGFTTCPGVERAVTEALAGRRSHAGFRLMTGQYLVVKL